MLGSLKAAAKIALVLVEIAAVRMIISSFLRVAEADPPHFPGAINAFGASLFQSAADGLGLLVISGDGDDGGMALPQSVFVDEQFVFGKSLGSRAFHRSANDATSDCAEDASCEPNGEDGTDSRYEKASQESRQRTRGG